MASERAEEGQVLPFALDVLGSSAKRILASLHSRVASDGCVDVSLELELELRPNANPNANLNANPDPNPTRSPQRHRTAGQTRSRPLAALEGSAGRSKHTLGASHLTVLFVCRRVDLCLRPSEACRRALKRPSGQASGFGLCADLCPKSEARSLQKTSRVESSRFVDLHRTCVQRLESRGFDATMQMSPYKASKCRPLWPKTWQLVGRIVTALGGSLSSDAESGRVGSSRVESGRVQSNPLQSIAIQCNPVLSAGQRVH